MIIGHWSPWSHRRTIREIFRFLSDRLVLIPTVSRLDLGLFDRDTDGVSEN